jgi:hypothetical protein
MKEFESGFGAGFIVGVLFSLFVGWVIVDQILDAQRPETWCGNIALSSKTEPYKVVYDRCMTEYNQRRNNNA